MTDKWLDVLGVKACFEVEENSHYHRQFVKQTIGVLSLGLYAESGKQPTPSKNDVGRRWTRSILVVTESSIRTFTRTKKVFSRAIVDEHELLEQAGSVELVIPFEDIVSFSSNQEHVVEIATLHISGTERYHYFKCKDFAKFKQLVEMVGAEIDAHKRSRINASEFGHAHRNNPGLGTYTTDEAEIVIVDGSIRYETLVGQQKVIMHVSRYTTLHIYIRTCKTDVYEMKCSMRGVCHDEERIKRQAALLFTSLHPEEEAKLEVDLKVRPRPYRERIYAVYGVAIAVVSILVSFAAYSPAPVLLSAVIVGVVGLGLVVEFYFMRHFDVSVCVESLDFPEKRSKLNTVTVVKDTNKADAEVAENGAEELLAALAPATSRRVPARWLEATNGDVTLARSKWEKALSWRQQQGIDKILQEEQPWFQVIKDNTTYAWTGQDNEGNLVYVQDLSKVATFVHRMKELGVSPAAFARTIVFLSEFWISKLLSTTGKFVHIIDLTGFSIRSFSTEIISFFRPMNQALVNYPELLRATYIINPPSAFRFVWKAITPFLAKRTIDKFNFVSGSTPERLAKVLTKSLPSDTLLKRFGGTLELEDIYNLPLENQVRDYVDKLAADATNDASES